MADQNKVQWVYSAGSQEELAKRYDEWAKDYDSDLERDFGWNGHEVAVEVFAKYVSSDARVIDVGVGTGLAGLELVKRGFSLLDARSAGLIYLAADPMYDPLRDDARFNELIDQVGLARP